MIRSKDSKTNNVSVFLSLSLSVFISKSIYLSSNKVVMNTGSRLPRFKSQLQH